MAAIESNPMVVRLNCSYKSVYGLPAIFKRRKNMIPLTVIEAVASAARAGFEFFCTPAGQELMLTWIKDGKEINQKLKDGWKEFLSVLPK